MSADAIDNEVGASELEAPQAVAVEAESASSDVLDDAGSEATVELIDGAEAAPMAELVEDIETAPADEPVVEDSESAPADEPVVADAAPLAPAEPGRHTVGYAIARQLAAAGTRLAFTVPGESFLEILDGFRAAGIRVVATRHEGAASFMAGAASQLSGKPQVVMATRAVGAANAAIGIHAARADSAPSIAIFGQVRRALPRSRGVPGGGVGHRSRLVRAVGGRGA